MAHTVQNDHPSFLRNPFVVSELKAIRIRAARLANDANSLLHLAPTLDGLQLSERVLLFSRKRDDLARSALSVKESLLSWQCLIEKLLT